MTMLPRRTSEHWSGVICHERRHGPSGLIINASVPGWIEPHWAPCQPSSPPDRARNACEPVLETLWSVQETNLKRDAYCAAARAGLLRDICRVISVVASNPGETDGHERLNLQDKATVLGGRRSCQITSHGLRSSPVQIEGTRLQGTLWNPCSVPARTVGGQEQV